MPSLPFDVFLIVFTSMHLAVSAALAYGMSYVGRRFSLSLTALTLVIVFVWSGPGLLSWTLGPAIASGITSVAKFKWLLLFILMPSIPSILMTAGMSWWQREGLQPAS